jgi:hypothetical protein
MHFGSIFQAEARLRHRRLKLGIGPLFPLAFSLAGLLADIAALLSRSSDLPPSIAFVLIAAAPALSAIAALALADDDFRIEDRNRRGWN